MAEAQAGGALQALPPGARFDLHMHSDRSDGRLPPDQVLRACADGGLHAFALTDHDLAPCLRAGRHQVGTRIVHVLHGVELSGCHRGVELHLLVYFSGPMPQDFRDFCTERARRRAGRYAAAAERLGLPGLPPPDDDAIHGRRSLTRMHLSRALVAAGHATDLWSAFEHYTASRHGLVPLIDLPFTEAITRARDAGGVTSWAHPDPERAEAWTPELVEAGLQGLEGLRPSCSRRDRNFFRKLARRHGLFLTGGSDYHGWFPGRLGDFGVHRRELSGFIDALASA